MDDNNAIKWYALAIVMLGGVGIAELIDRNYKDELSATGTYLIHNGPADMVQDAGEWYDAQQK